MPTRNVPSRTLLATLAAGLLLPLVGCGDSSSPAATPRDPGPSSASAAPAGHLTPNQEVRRAVARALNGRSATFGGDLDLKDHSLRLSGSVDLRAHRYEITATGYVPGDSRNGVQLFHSPTLSLSRGVAGGAGCWWPMASTYATYRRKLPPQIQVMRSARATSRRGGVLHGSVAAVPLFEVLGSTRSLAAMGVHPTRGGRVSGTFSIYPGGGLSFRTTWARALASAGAYRNWHGEDFWTVDVAGSGSSPLASPRATQIIDVPSTDPAWRATLDACSARMN